MDHRLIIVEGCPGSGKSSTSQFLCRQLQRAGHACRWYYETSGNKSTPIVDSESITLSVHDWCVGTTVFEHGEDHMEHLVGHMGEGYEVVFAPFDLSFVDLGE